MWAVRLSPHDSERSEEGRWEITVRKYPIGEGLHQRGMKKTPLIEVSLYLPNVIIHKFSNAKSEKRIKKRLFKIIAICFGFPGFPKEPKIIPIMGLIISTKIISFK